MAPKRKRPVAKNLNQTKRAKFTLEEVLLPELTHEGVVLATGAGDVGQLGLGPDVLEKTKPGLLELKQEIVDVFAGGMHTVCLTKEGKILTFGCNDEGALGRVTEGKQDAEFTAAEVDLPGKVIQISAGDSHTAALLEDGRVFAWGTFRDSHGNMGLTLDGNKWRPFELLEKQKVVKIASGADHLVLLTSQGNVWTCGCGEQGQLGRTTKRGSDRESRGGMGKENLARFLTPATINLKPRLRLHFDNIWAGTYTTYARVAESGEMYVFGLNNFNQIGLETTEPVYLPTKSPDFSQYKWEHISGGQHHTIALTEDGKVYVIGRKEYGRLGLGQDCDDAKTLTEIKELSGKKIINVACGSTVSFAVTEDGKLFGWGMGTNGQLGLSEDEDYFIPTHVESKQLKTRKVIRVSSGGQHTIILCSSGTNLAIET